MGRRLPKPSEQKLTSIRIIGTAFEPVKDAEMAFKEANGARLALAKYKQIKHAFDDNDPSTVAMLLDSVKDDDSAGAALLEIALHELRARKRVASRNEVMALDVDAKEKEYCQIADRLHLKRRKKYSMARAVQKELVKRGKEVVNIRTIVRAFDHQNYS
jgi:hypothetical protein